MKLRPTRSSEPKKVSNTKLGKALVDALFMSNKVAQPRSKWRKHTLVVEFLSKNEGELEVSNLTISESGSAGKQSPDSTDGVALIKFIKALKSI
jgi:hypothetical protein